MRAGSSGRGRRHWLRAGGAFAIVGLGGCATRAPFGGRDPFTLGVASGYPTGDGAVIWTRLAPEPLAPDGGGGIGAPVEVAWEVAEDERFARVVRRGAATAESRAAHSVRAEPAGLAPQRWYFYRFIAEGVSSPVGRLCTAPAVDAAPAQLCFAFASCQQYEQGYFGAYRHLIAEEPELVLHLGDYIYESSWGRDFVRRHDGPEPEDLAGYRKRYALYKSDRDLQAAHAAAPWLVTWDDHEVENDYADDRSQDLWESARFLRRRAAAYRAYFEHMPLPTRMAPDGAAMRIHTRLDWGRLVRFHLLDDRQYRSHQVCPRAGRGGSNSVTDAACPARLGPTLSLLGAAQERWLEAGLAESPARWNVIAQQTLMAPRTVRERDGAALHWTDGWDGYPAARRRLLDHLAQTRPGNPLVLSGDVHAFFVSDLRPDFDDPRSPVVGSELCGSSITSQGPVSARLDRLGAENPHLKFADGSVRGYVAMTVGARMTEARLRAVDSVKVPRPAIRTAASFAIEDGKQGPVKASS